MCIWDKAMAMTLAGNDTLFSVKTAQTCILVWDQPSEMGGIELKIQCTAYDKMNGKVTNKYMYKYNSSFWIYKANARRRACKTYNMQTGSKCKWRLAFRGRNTEVPQTETLPVCCSGIYFFMDWSYFSDSNKMPLLIKQLVWWTQGFPPQGNAFDE